jgi:hypothetical protein
MAVIASTEFHLELLPRFFTTSTAPALEPTVKTSTQLVSSVLTRRLSPGLDSLDASPPAPASRPHRSSAPPPARLRCPVPSAVLRPRPPDFAEPRRFPGHLNPQILPLKSHRRRWVCSFRCPQTAPTAWRLLPAERPWRAYRVQPPMGWIVDGSLNQPERIGYVTISSQLYVAAELSLGPIYARTCK